MLAASAAFHKSSRVMLAVMKFFLGQDRDDDSDAESGDEDEDEDKKKGPTKEDIYKAYHKVRTLHRGGGRPYGGGGRLCSACACAHMRARVHGLWNAAVTYV